MRHLTILDFTTGDVHIYPIGDEFEYEPATVKTLIESLGYNDDNCQWMFGTDNITFHKEALK